MQQYEHLVKHYDRQLLNQLKDREYNVQKMQLENSKTEEEVENTEEEINMNDKETGNDKEGGGGEIDDEQEDNFLNRISKIESAGYSRNRIHFEFVDSKKDYERAQMLFYKETCLALQDGLITEIGNFQQKFYIYVF